MDEAPTGDIHKEAVCAVGAQEGVWELHSKALAAEQEGTAGHAVGAYEGPVGGVQLGGVSGGEVRGVDVVGVRGYDGYLDPHINAE